MLLACALDSAPLLKAANVVGGRLIQRREDEAMGFFVSADPLYLQLTLCTEGEGLSSRRAKGYVSVARSNRHCPSARARPSSAVGPPPHGDPDRPPCIVWLFGRVASGEPLEITAMPGPSSP